MSSGLVQPLITPPHNSTRQLKAGAPGMVPGGPCRESEDGQMSDYRLLIDGKLVSGAMALNVVNPATEEVVAVAPRADRAQLEQAVAAAKAAYPRWSQTPVRDRGALLARLADAGGVRQAEVAEILTAENGKPIAQALHEMEAVVAAMRYYAGLDLAPRILKEDASQKIIEQPIPLGVVGAISAWNVPMILLAAKIAPALLAGNTVVAKPAATTPLAALKLGELCADLLPPGVINVIVDANDLGDALTSHPDVAKIAFTGSTATGRKVMESAAGTLKRLTLELGGNDAAIVLDDVNPKEIAPKLFAGATFNFGQGGSSWSKNLDGSFAVASQINSGTVWINRHLNLQPDIPFRGDKQSGIGTELGYAGLEEYTQPRIINMAKQQA